MWKRLLETSKQAAAAAPKPATPAAATAPKSANPKRVTPAANAPPKLSTLKNDSSSRRAAVTSATAVSQDSLLRLKQAAASKKTILPSSVPYPHAQDEEEDPHALTKALMSAIDGPDDMEESSPSEAPAEDSEDAENAVGNRILDIQWFVPPPSKDPLMHWRREVATEKKKHYIFKNTESRRFTKLMQMCDEKLGAESTLEFFGKLGRDTGAKEFNAMIRTCLRKARGCTDIDSAVEHIYRAYNLVETMKDKGLRIEEDSYDPFLLYLVEVGMSEEFEMFSTFFKEANPQSYSRIAYYEMLHCIRVQDEGKIQELCHSVENHNEEAHYDIAESYMLAFAESGRKMDLIALLELLDLVKVSDSQYISNIFKSLGRLELENYAEKLLQGMRPKDSSRIVFLRVYKCSPKDHPPLPFFGDLP